MAFPQVAATATSDVDTNTTSHTVSLPAGIQAGDLLVVIFNETRPSSSEGGAPAGWEAEYDDNGTDDRIMVMSRVADGSEGASVTVTTVASRRSAHVAFRITGFEGDIEVAGNGAGTDPPNLAPSWGSDDDLWIAVIGGANSIWSATAAPANYGDLLGATNAPFDSPSRCAVYTARREAAASSEDPGEFTFSGAPEHPHSVTIAIRPAAGGGGGFQAAWAAGSNVVLS